MTRPAHALLALLGAAAAACPLACAHHDDVQGAMPVIAPPFAPDAGAPPPASARETPPVRAYLLHISHYDPEWNLTKDHEPRFDLDLALEVVSAMAAAHMNALIIDIADGVRFESHPELARPYSVPMADLARLADAAHGAGLDVVPKLNFSKSAVFTHNKWLRPYDALPDDDAYFRHAFAIIDEVIAATHPKAFFHIGMDEDQDRDVPHYVAAVEHLRAGLAARGLRTVMWNDSAEPNEKAVKSLAAEKLLPRDVIQVPWAYHKLVPEVIERLRGEGFDVWGAPGVVPEQVQGWRDDVLRFGGSGLVMTQWIPCRAESREKILGAIRKLGPLYAGLEHPRQRGSDNLLEP